MKAKQVNLRIWTYVTAMIVITLVTAACGTGAAVESAVDAVAEQSTAAEPEADHEGEEDADHHEEDEGEHREHGTHEHGAATLTVAWSSNDMEIELDTPAFNLFGFEYEPSADEEIRLVEEAVTELESGALLAFNEEAGCSIINTAITLGWEHEDEHEGEEDGDHADEDGETHSDVEAWFSLECSSPEEINSLDLSRLFARFPNFEHLNAQWVSDTNQSAQEMSAESPVLTFN